MWILTPVGFFSIVRKPEDRYRGTLTVRARVRGDLEALRDRYLPTLEAIDDDPERDYRFRATAPRGDVTAALAQLAEEEARQQPEKGTEAPQHRAQTLRVVDLHQQRFRQEIDPQPAGSPPGDQEQHQDQGVDHSRCPWLALHSRRQHA